MPALIMVFDNIQCHSLGHPMTEAVAQDIIEGL